MRQRAGYRQSHADVTGRGRAKVRDRGKLVRDAPTAPGADRLSNAEAWAFLRAHGWGAVFAPLMLRGHVVGRVTGPGGGHRIVRMWCLYDVATWDLVWTSREVDLSRVVAAIARYTARGHPMPPTRRLPALVAAILKARGKVPPEPTAEGRG